MLTFVALAPIIYLVIDLVIFKRNILLAALITSVLTILIALTVWHVDAPVVPLSLLRGGLVSLDILLIIFGALLFLNLLRSRKIIDSIEYYLRKVSADCRVQLIILAWLFGSLIEGSAGFGTPAVIVAPLLVYIGFPTFLSVSLALLANSIAAAFGAVGTPVRIGFAELGTPEVVTSVAGMGAIVCCFVPVLLLAMLTRGLKKDRAFFTDGLPFAIWAGVAMGAPYFGASYLGIEFPSLLGPLVGLALVLLTSRRGILMPKTTVMLKQDDGEKPAASLGQILAPYGLLIVCLIAGRFVLPSFKVQLHESLTYSFNLFNPGIILMFVSFVLMLWYKVRGSEVSKLAVTSGKAVVKTAATIFLIVGLMQIMINSGENASGLDSMIRYASSHIENAALPIISPMLGAFGAFIAGSVTVSNLIFAVTQSSAAEVVGLSTLAVLSLQILGATAGNMVSIPNIMAAQAAVGGEGEETRILMALAPYTGIYILLVMALGFVGLLLVF